MTSSSATAKGKKRAREDEDALAESHSGDDEDGESRASAIGSGAASKKLKARTFGEQLEMRKGKKRKAAQEAQPPAKKPRRSSESDYDALKAGPLSAPTTAETPQQEDVDMDDAPAVSDELTSEKVTAEPISPTSVAPTSTSDQRKRKKKKKERRIGEHEAHADPLRVAAVATSSVAEDEQEPATAPFPTVVPSDNNTITSPSADKLPQLKRKKKKKKKRQRQQPDSDAVVEDAATTSAKPSVYLLPAIAKGPPTSDMAPFNLSAFIARMPPAALKVIPVVSPGKGEARPASASPVSPLKFTAKTVLNLNGPPPPVIVADGNGAAIKRRRKKKKMTRKKAQQAANSGQPSANADRMDDAD